jgi:hypothetical protein
MGISVFPATGIQETIVDAAGDLIVGTADNTVGRLAIGTALQLLRVNAGVTALEYADAPAGYLAPTLGSTSIASGATVTTIAGLTLTAPKVNLAFNAQTGTTYTLVAGDSGKLVTTSNGSAVTITIPTGVFAAGEQINIQSIGVGLTTISGAAVTITSTGASAIAPILRARYSAATIICTAAGVFTVIGDIV